MFCKKNSVACCYFYWYFSIFYSFWTIENTNFFKCILYSDRMKRKAFVSKFWSYWNNARMFFILNGSFQSRMICVSWKRIKILKLPDFKINYNIWVEIFQFHCNFLFICCQGIIFFSKLNSFRRFYLIWQEKLDSFPETILFSYVLFILFYKITFFRFL